MNTNSMLSRVVCAAEDCERGYNLKAAFPDFPEVLVQWQQATRTFQADAMLHADLAYGPKPLQRFDYYPAVGETCPLLVFIHGGYWQGGDKSDIGFIAAPYVAAGISVAVVNYSLAPDVSIAVMTEEMTAFLAYVQTHGDALGIDRASVSFMGHSAGAHLATFAAATSQIVPIRAVFAISGVFDLQPLIPTSLNHALQLTPQRADDLSPLLYAGPNATHVYTIIGADETEQFHLQSTALAACWPQVRGHYVIPDTHHYTVLWPLADTAHPVCQAIIQVCKGEMLT